MATVGKTKGRTDEEERAAEIMEQAHFGFIQTLPADAIVTEEGVYSSRTEMIMERRRREEEAAAEKDNSGGGSS
jgi:hypothetical protein